MCTSAVTDALAKAGRSVQVGSVKEVQTPAGMALLVAYNVNSEPNAVTGKQVRLEANRYYFFKNGKLATLVLTAPLGANNVDQWQRISQSFGWQ